MSLSILNLESPDFIPDAILDAADCALLPLDDLPAVPLKYYAI